MKNKETPLSFDNLINIRVAVKLMIRDRISCRRTMIQSFGLNSDVVKSYSKDVRDNISAYRAAKNIQISY